MKQKGARPKNEKITRIEKTSKFDSSLPFFVNAFMISFEYSRYKQKAKLDPVELSITTQENDPPRDVVTAAPTISGTSSRIPGGNLKSPTKTKLTQKHNNGSADFTMLEKGFVATDNDIELRTCPSVLSKDILAIFLESFSVNFGGSIILIIQMVRIVQAQTANVIAVFVQGKGKIFNNRLQYTS